MIGFSDLNIVVIDVNVYRFFGFAFNDDEVVAGVFHFGTEVSAQVSTSDFMDRIGGRIHGGNGSSAGADGARTGQRAGSDNDFVGFIESLCFRRDFIPKDFVAQSCSADPIFLCRTRCDFTGSEVDSKTLSGPTVFLCF